VSNPRISLANIPDKIGVFAKSNYREFLRRKLHEGAMHGFEPLWMPSNLFPFQRAVSEWSIRKGRGAEFADCGMGKTAMQLTWAENVARKADGRVLILTPIAVAFQTVREGEKFGIEVTHRREGLQPGDRIVVTNYERLHYFDPNDFQGVVCDESSILKGFDGVTRAKVTDFMRKRPYRLLCTATAAPNDHIELGTSSEALGEMGATDMLNQFFKKSERVFTRSDEYRSGLYKFRGHAEQHFWRWVCSWARAIRKPSDMGFDDGDFKLPALNVREHVVYPKNKREGFLFDMPAVGLGEEREDLRRTLNERCEMAAELINAHDRPAVAWCNLNTEGDLLTKLIRGAEQVSGKDSEEHKEEVFSAFIRGEIKVLVSKPKIAGFGLNLQHCAHQTFFPSHSYEQYYQAVRRSWRFGQKSAVTVDMITTPGQGDVVANLKRKSHQADKMFEQLVDLMWKETKIEKPNDHTKESMVPTWL
jgi:superfamily II DNA or RNA helicase